MGFPLDNVFLLLVISSSLGIPFPEPEAEPGYKVIKTVQFWDDDKDGDSLIREEIGDAKLDFNNLVDLDDNIDGAEGRTLIGYVNDDGHLHLNHQHHHHHDEDEGPSGQIQEDADTKALVSDQFLNNPDVTVDSDGLKCIKKLMQIQYTDYTEVMTCVHKTEERCHTSYVTDFEPHQEQKCDEKFEKRCSIYYENVAVNEEVEVCKTYLCPDCSREGPEECDTVYDTVCETKRKVHNVLDDVVNCETVEEKKCEPMFDGLLTREKCDTWPVEKCTVEQVSVNKTTPETSCREEPRTLCAPRGCAEKECHACENQIKAAILAKPVEECDLEPQKVCRHVTKLVPRLKAVEQCVEVPQEVCGVSKIRPEKKTRPSIQNWCIHPDTEQVTVKPVSQ